MPERPRWIVLKFGGTSVSSRARWETIAQVVRERVALGARPVVVVSAIRGVSDALERLLPAAVRGDAAPLLHGIRAQHEDLARQLGVDFDALAAPGLDEIERLAAGVGLTGEFTPRLQARAMAAGELTSSRLGEAWLRQIGVSSAWVDARSCLVARRPASTPHPAAWLSASCSHTPDPALSARLAALDARVIVTQGFIARNPSGETVLLGRGGSDTSAAVFAAQLEAERCEIWTDVPGLFTADPRDLPDARLLRALDYDEAQEIATMGARVLHPRAVPPLRAHGIPLHVRCTPRPELEGTVVSADAGASAAQIKAVSSRGGVTLVSLDTVGMWQEVGFLAQAFGIFAEHGLSVDLVSTSETNVTVSLDPSATPLDDRAARDLVDHLSRICTARIIGPCASISLVGRRVRGILHRLGPALELFEEQRVHLVSQAANDLNLTFVVDEDQEARLVRDLHGLLFKTSRSTPTLGPTWRELFHGPEPERAPVPRWWERKRDALLSIGARSPIYVYDGPTLDARAGELVGLDAVDRVFYAVKANPHAGVLRRLDAAGVGFECVSPGELRHVLATLPHLDRDRLLFTPNFAARHEYVEAFATGAHVTLDDIFPMQAWPDVFAGRSVLLRLDPGRGRGHHEFVRTAGATSKFGIAPGHVESLRDLLDAHGVGVTGLHAHSGSGIRTPENWSEVALFLASAAELFDGVRVLNLGGGFGVPEKPGDERLDLGAVAASLSAVRQAHPGFSLWIEPGRYLVAEAGVLLTRVTQRKRKSEVAYVGVDTGMNSLVRPALYGAWHEIVNLTRLDQPRTLVANVVGPICESGDTLGYGRRLAPPEEGDVLLIATAGAYGRAMASRYNLREPADEVLIG